MINKRTTPSFLFTLPSNLEYDIVEITFKQGVTYIVKKYVDETLDDGMYITDDGKFGVTFTQEETNLFDANAFSSVQVRVKTTTGAVLASSVYKVMIRDILNESIL